MGTTRELRDVEAYGTAYTYGGRPLDPAQVVMHVRQGDGSIVEVEEYDEWRLTGREPGGSPYDFTARTREQIDGVRAIWRKIMAGGSGWTDAKLWHRKIRIERTAWAAVD